MTIEEKKQLIKQAADNYVNCKNRYNYMSFGNAKIVDDMFDTYAYKNIKNEIIYFGSPKSFNDEHEFEFKIDYNDWKYILFNNDSTLKKYEKNYEMYKDFDVAVYSLNNKDRNRANKFKNDISIRIKNFTEELKNTFYVYCIAPSYYDSYFWKEYCNDYNGICCEYDIVNLFYDYNKNDFHFVHQKVAYSDSNEKFIPEYLNADEISLLKTDNPKYYEYLKYNHENSDEAFIRLFATKSMDWKCEMENRFIANSDSMSTNYISAKPVKVYIGYNVLNEIKEEYIKMLNSKGIPSEIIYPDDCINFKEEEKLVLEILDTIEVDCENKIFL